MIEFLDWFAQSPLRVFCLLVFTCIIAGTLVSIAEELKNR